jgi:hypothetical protein
MGLFDRLLRRLLPKEGHNTQPGGQKSGRVEPGPADSHRGMQPRGQGENVELPPGCYMTKDGTKICVTQDGEHTVFEQPGKPLRIAHRKK